MVNPMRSLDISIFLYTFKSWTLTAEAEKKRLDATNEHVRRKIQTAIGEYGTFLILANKRKLRLIGHVSRASGLVKDNYTEHRERKKEKEVDRRKGGKAMLKSGQ